MLSSICARALFTCALLLMPPLLLRAQNTQSSVEPATPGTNVTQSDGDARTRRSQAYAKLLEGQRYYVILRTAPSESKLAQLLPLAQKAFKDAAALDPSLAEAYTAQAELAFYFTRSLDDAAGFAAQSIGIDHSNFGAHRILSRVQTLRTGLGRTRTLDQKAVDLALGELRDVVRIDPTDAEGWALLSELYQRTGKDAEAIKALEEWAATPPTSDVGFFQAVVRDAELAPATAFRRLGALLIKLHRNADGLNALMRAIELDPTDAESVDLLGKSVWLGTDDQTILPRLKIIAANNQDNPTLLQLVARLQIKSGAVDDGLATIKTAIERLDKQEDNRDAILLRVRLAEILTEAQRHADAVTLYEEVLTKLGIGQAPLASESDTQIASDILPRIISAQKSAGAYEDAMRSIGRMRLLFGAADSSADEQLVLLLKDQGKRREALVATQEARVKFPRESGFVRMEASLLTDLGRVDEGIALLRKGLAPATAAADKGSVEDFQTMLFMSSLYAQAERGPEAVASAQQALLKRPSDDARIKLAALITLASAQERAGDFKAAEESLRSVLKDSPDNPTALNNLGYFLVEHNDRLEEALTLITAAVRAEPTNSSFLDSLGWVYFKLGKFTEAERYLQDAVNRSPRSFTTNDHLGDLFKQQGNKERARESWQKALAVAVATDNTAKIKAKLRAR